MINYTAYATQPESDVPLSFSWPLMPPADEGFGVGHTRDTETKGIWMWSKPQMKTSPDGTETSILYVDTEVI